MIYRPSFRKCVNGRQKLNLKDSGIAMYMCALYMYNSDSAVCFDVVLQYNFTCNVFPFHNIKRKL